MTHPLTVLPYRIVYPVFESPTIYKDAFSSGYRARLTGKKFADNPYAVGLEGRPHAGWRAGFCLAINEGR